MPGRLTHSAQRGSMGSVPGMTALVEAGAGARVPMVRDALPLSRQLIEHLRSTDLKASSPVERDAGRVNAVSHRHRHGRWRMCVVSTCHAIFNEGSGITGSIIVSLRSPGPLAPAGLCSVSVGTHASISRDRRACTLCRPIN